jgi:hypothetical protein
MALGAPVLYSDAGRKLKRSSGETHYLLHRNRERMDRHASWLLLFSSVLNRHSRKFQRGIDLMRKILSLICILAMPCASWAQTDKASWTNLRTLQPGQKIQVVDMHSKKHSGSFVNFTETTISYQDTSGQQTFPRQDVRRVQRMGDKRRLRNTLIGAGVGAGVGAGIGAAAWEDRGFIGGKGVGALFCASIGFLGGAIIGALIPSHNTIYSVNSQ